MWYWQFVDDVRASGALLLLLTLFRSAAVRTRPAEGAVGVCV